MFETKTTSLKAKLLIGATSIAAFGASATAAFAQQVAENTETVIVTGSRIPQRNIEGANPVTAVSSEEITLRGATSIVDLMKTLPSVVPDGDSDTVNNGSAGLATIDLRNLGTKRTLVLVDGKRLVASDSSLNVDTNVIPAGMVERLEVLTGGDSAIYGSDAVAGVINIILKKDFEGLVLDSQATVTDHWDGWKHDSYAMLGFNSADGKGNVTIYGEYNHRDAVSAAARDFGAQALASPNVTGCGSQPANIFGGFCNNGGSGTEANGRIKALALGGPYAGTNGLIFTPSQTLVPYAGQTFNFAPFQYYQTQGVRYSLGADGHYDLNENVDFYTRLTFAENRTVASLGPSPLSNNFFINCGNPLLSTEERQSIFGTTAATGTSADCSTEAATIYTTAANGNPVGVPTTPAGFASSQRLVSFALRLVQDGPRVYNFSNDVYQLVGGVKGKIPFLPGWTYDASAQYGHTLTTRVEANDALKGNFQNALLVDPATGNCYVGGTCVPANIFTSGGLSPAAVNYFRENLLSIGNLDQIDIQAIATGDLGRWGGQLPWAHDPIGLSVGGEYRQEQSSFVPDQNKATGNLVGFSAATATRGGFRVAEGFGEVAIPIIQDMAFAQDLSLHAAYRFSSYDRAGDTNTYQIGATWAPIPDIKFRTSYDRAVRAPNVSELFTPAGGSSSNPGFDPCSGKNGGTVTTAALCQATGVPAGSVFSANLNCPTNQCQGAVGGNPFLKPEVATTRELGVVLTPSFIPGLNATIDYYNVKIRGNIAATPLQTIVNNCYSTTANPSQSAANTYCTFIHRDVLGQIDTQNSGYVIQAEGNIGQTANQGVDFAVNYNMDLSMIGWENAGGLSFSGLASWVLLNNSQFSGGVVVKCAGLYGTQCGAPQNRLRGSLRTAWTDPSGDLSVSLLWRYVGAASFEAYRFQAGGFSPAGGPSLNFGAKNYFDLSANYALSPSLDLRAGVRNLFNQNPPLTDNNSAPASAINTNTFPSIYDTLGRQLFVGVTAKL